MWVYMLCCRGELFWTLNGYICVFHGIECFRMAISVLFMLCYTYCHLLFHEFGLINFSFIWERIGMFLISRCFIYDNSIYGIFITSYLILVIECLVSVYASEIYAWSKRLCFLNRQ